VSYSKLFSDNFDVPLCVYFAGFLAKGEYSTAATKSRKVRISHMSLFLFFNHTLLSLPLG